ncbi:hypothetical protein [Nonomuraea recticatena]|uniref:hypothetical protein n=1 Tax=Nonomuraea recticatena TaxID=46178 RepID=UPI0031F8FFCD
MIWSTSPWWRSTPRRCSAARRGSARSSLSTVVWENTVFTRATVASSSTYGLARPLAQTGP